MLTRYLTAVTIIVAGTLLCGCNSKDGRDTTLRFVDTRNDHALTGRVKTIEWTALEADGVHLLGDAPELIPAEDGSLLVIDRLAGNIFRYSAEGRFLNTLGRRGNGPGEYLHITNIQDRNGEVLVYDSSNKVLSFSYDGHLNETTEHAPGLQFWMTDLGLLAYRGFGMGLDYRLSLNKKDGTKTFLSDDSHAKVLHFSQDVPIFHEAGQVVYFTDSYKPIVRAFQKGEVSNALTIDFGAYAIPKTFYSYGDSFAAAEALLSRPFAVINRYLRSGEKVLIEVYLQETDGKARYAYAIQDNAQWHWFSLGQTGEDPFAGAIRQFKEDKVYFLVNAALAEKAGAPTSPEGCDYFVCRMTL